MHLSCIRSVSYTHLDVYKRQAQGGEEAAVFNTELLPQASLVEEIPSEPVSYTHLWEWLTGKQITAFDFSAVVTGILIAFQVPVTTPVILILISGIFAIIVVKQLFGGIGSNFMNPALAGRLLLMVVWPGKIIQYVPAAGNDAVSSATVLAAMKAGEQGQYSWLDMFLGSVPGALGETSKPVSYTHLYFIQCHTSGNVFFCYGFHAFAYFCLLYTSSCV